MKERWRTKKLGELSSVSYGYTEKASSEPIGPKFLRITDIQNDSVNWNTVPYCKIDTDTLSQQKLRDGDLVFARTGATTGKSYLICNPPDAVCASYLIRLRLRSSDILPKFVSYYFGTKSYWDIVAKGISGSAQGGFNASKLAEVEIPAPPLAEQDRIIAILDEAFAELAIATINAERNLKNSRDLFDSYLNSVFARGGEGWKAQRLGDVVISVNTGPFGSLLHKSDYVKDGIPIVNPINIVDGSVVPDSSKTVNVDTVRRLGAYKLSKNDIVVGRRGEIGRCAVVRDEQAGWLCGTGCFFIRTGELVNADFLCHLLRSVDYSRKLERVATGATMKNLSNTALQNFVISLPSVSEQQRLEAAFRNLAKETERAAETYERKLGFLGALKQSILQKAFSGELTSPSSQVIEEAAE